MTDPDDASVQIRTADGDSCYSTPPALAVAGVDAAQILQRWRDVLGHTHQHLSTAFLADIFTTRDGNEDDGME